MLDPVQFASTPAPGRSCGTCTLCCKVYDVPSLDKPMGTWCSHCLPGRGCGIHATRPQHCRSFHCYWMTTDFLGPEWKPQRCAFVLSVDPIAHNLLVQVDPGRPAAWRAEPYRAMFREWAIAGLSQGRHVVVFVNRNATVVLPDREEVVGPMMPGDRLVFSRRMTPDGPTADVRKVPAKPVA
jgi:hypothetical protein